MFQNGSPSLSPDKFQLPARFAEVCPVALAQGADNGPKAIFQRFDLLSRQLKSSLIPLAMELLPDIELAAAIRSGLVSSSLVETPLLVYASVEALVGGQCANTPNTLIYRLHRYVEIDHAHGQAWVVGSEAKDQASVLQEIEQRLVRARPSLQHVAPESDWSHDVTFEDYAKRVSAIKAELARGAIHGVNLSLGLARTTQADPFDIYRECVTANPSPYGYVLQDAGFSLIGSSPLAFMQLSDGKLHLETDAGTRPVTGDTARDAAAEADLRCSHKDAAEHQIVVDAELEALAPIAADQQIYTIVSKEIRRFSHVMHLYSAFEIALSPELDVADAIIALAPAAAVSGYPKRTALALARQLEQKERGPYGGVFGVIYSGEEADLAVVIRSMWITDGVASLRVGGKVVADSQPEMEYREALSKSRFLVNALAKAEAVAPA